MDMFTELQRSTERLNELFSDSAEKLATDAARQV